MMLKKLKVAAAVATMFATVGGVHAATISQSGGTLAMETIKPGALATPQSNFTRVRAPAVTYSWANGPNAQANGTQSFQVVFTLGAEGALWAFDAATSGEVPGILPAFPQVALMARNPANAVETISAQLRGAVPASRINVRATNPAAGQFAIVLRQIDVGNTLPGSDLAVHPNNNRSVTYRFELVNNTATPINLSELDITFNTPKTAGVITDYFTCEAGAPNCRQALDAATTVNAEFAAIHNLAGLSVDTRGHSGAAFNNSPACGPDPLNRISLRGNSGINNFQGTEPNTNVPSTTVPVFNPSYLQIRRTLDVIVSNAGNPNRLIATTNSFAENNSGAGFVGANLTPTNGIGGMQGGRYTFVPTRKAVLPIQFGPALNPTVVGAGPASVGAASSGDERDVALGGVTFQNRFASASDRLMSSNFYIFKDTPAIPPFGDFDTPLAANNDGGVDINATAPLPALRLTGLQTGRIAAGGTLRLVWLGGLPVGNQTCAAAAAGNNGIALVNPVAATGGNFTWDVTHAQLLLAANPLAAANQDTLAGKTLTICYNVPGNTTIPAVKFTGLEATLFKDDVTEQNNVSCPGNLAEVYGGVKVDVRNFNLQMVTEPQAGWMGILRVVNNSETDTAQVDAQYIWNNGTYGKWGTIIPALPPRAAVYVNATQVVNSLTNNADSLPLNPGNTGLATPARYDDVPTAALLAARQAGVGTNGAGSIRLRISADVPTIRVQNYLFNATTQALTEVSSSQGADFANIESSNRDHIDQDAQTDIRK